jgi:hypothetical protein
MTTLSLCGFYASLIYVFIREVIQFNVLLNKMANNDAIYFSLHP